MLRFSDLSNAARSQLQHLSDITPLNIDQTVRRVFKKEILESGDKYISIFEPHTDIIVKGERDIVYGHKTFYSVGTSGLVLDTILVQGNPKDTEYFINPLERHEKIFRRFSRKSSPTEALPLRRICILQKTLASRSFASVRPWESRSRKWSKADGYLKRFEPFEQVLSR
ncbi:MAG: hypothetical protein EOP04_19355 [Proteobacteria bacterium]|nr:MAG: hypothetical protein EOP04_19355 [Pseudomonadota bacterium]